MSKALFLSGLAEFHEDSVEVITYEQYANYRRNNGKNVTADPINFPQSIEFEFSSNVLITSHTIGGSEPLEMRYIYFGEFRFDNLGVMNKARLDSAISVFRQPDTTDEYGYLDIPENPIHVENVGAFTSWEDSMDLILDSKNTRHEYDTIDGNITTIKGEGKEAIFNTFTSTFLTENWYEEIFSSDLLRGSNSYFLSGSESADNIKMDNTDSFKNDIISTGKGDDIVSAMRGADYIKAGEGDDIIHGNHGRDVLHGEKGNDTIRGGHGPDQIFAGSGSDWIWGGIGSNTIDAGLNDGNSDDIFVPVDQVHNTQFGNPGGANADILNNLGSEDRIFMHGSGISDASLSYEATSHNGINGIGIYANGALEALVTGNFNTTQIDSMTTGGFFA